MTAVFLWTLRTLLPRLALVASLATVAALWLAGPRAATDLPVDGGANWLHLPISLVAFVAVLGAVDVWPGFGRDRPGRGLIDRLDTGPADGAVATAAGALVAAAATLAVLAAVFAAVRGIGPADRLVAATAWRFASGGSSAALHERAPRATLELEDPRTTRLTLRPRLVVRPGAPLRPAGLTVRDATTGAELVPPREIPHDGARVDVPIPPGVQRVVLERLPGPGFAIVLDPLRVAAVRPDALSPTLNAIGAASLALVPIAAGLLAAIAARRRLGRSVLLFATGGLLLATPGLGLAPHVRGIAAAAAGQSCLASHPMSGVSS